MCRHGSARLRDESGTKAIKQRSATHAELCDRSVIREGVFAAIA